MPGSLHSYTSKPLTREGLPKPDPSFLQSLYRFLIPKGMIFPAHHLEKRKEFGLIVRYLTEKLFSCGYLSNMFVNSLESV